MKFFFGAPKDRSFTSLNFFLHIKFFYIKKTFLLLEEEKFPKNNKNLRGVRMDENELENDGVKPQLRTFFSKLTVIAYPFSIFTA